MKSQTSFLSFCLLGLLSLPGFTQNADIDPSGLIAPSGGSATRGVGDIVAGPFDVETGPYDNRCLGVEQAWGSFWVTGRGHSAIGDNYMIHQYDMSGNYITSFAQNISVANSGGWGGRDMEADETANLLYVGNDNGHVEIMSYDPLSASLSYSSTMVTSVSGTVRALCEGGTGTYFTKSFTGDISEFDMATGNVLNTFSNSAVSAYGFGYDSVNNTIWSTDSGAGGTELDPATGQTTGRSFNGSGGSQGGCDVYDSPLGNGGAGGPVMVVMTQETPDNLYVYDTVGTPPPAWANLPTTFVDAGGYAENFDSLGGVVPSHMATNHGLQGASDPEAWCNVGQQGVSGLTAFSGAQSLEMGLDPASINYHDVWNSLVIGLNGGGSTALTLDMQVIDHGEEADVWDGVWVSDNGTDWHFTGQDWNPLSSSWQAVTGIDLSGAGADTTGDFYLMFAQNDNFPCGYLDGVQIDDLVINGGSTNSPFLHMAVNGAGYDAVATLSNCTPLGTGVIGWSINGGGPTSTSYGDAYLTPPYRTYTVSLDANGGATQSHLIPAHAVGVRVWVHALDRTAGKWSNHFDFFVL